MPLLYHISPGMKLKVHYSAETRVWDIPLKGPFTFSCSKRKNGMCCFMQACFIPNYSEVLFMGKWLQGIRSAPWHVIFSLQGVHFYALQGNIGTALLLSNLLGLLVSSYLIPHFFLSHVRQKNDVIL